MEWKVKGCEIIPELACDKIGRGELRKVVTNCVKGNGVKLEFEWDQIWYNKVNLVKFSKKNFLFRKLYSSFVVFFLPFLDHPDKNWKKFCFDFCQIFHINASADLTKRYTMCWKSKLCSNIKFLWKVSLKVNEVLAPKNKGKMRLWMND